MIFLCIFKGWLKLLHDLISREGPFLETGCVPIVGLTIFMWPLVVLASIILTILSSIFVGIYASVVVYQYCEMRDKELLDGNVLTAVDLCEWMRGKNNDETFIVGVGLPCYSLLQALMFSIKSNSSDVLLLEDFEITYFNRPKDKLLD
ncbi:unnamed protein product [Sphenostylis stenocarpa]|uniref:Uncharacterized protein n=1 Tax=Sphenostylis stenocarpa TaxID=92480 RepID=A0AA86SLL4_9FABA|nr:unnamed protein product [Sphenostylis stenocarpa]